MGYVVFYSWASDWPSATNRGFIEKALDQATRRIGADQQIAVEPVIDRDTSGLPGSPDIASAIFGKIEKADVFVADVTDIRKWFSKNLGRARPHPNPNVLIELGYAASILGWEKIVLVVNTSRSRIEDLPFDLRQRRCIGYEHGRVGKNGRQACRQKLAGALERALRDVLRIVPSGGSPVASLAHAATSAREADPFEERWATWQIFAKARDTADPSGWSRSAKCMVLRLISDDFRRSTMDERLEAQLHSEISLAFSEDAQGLVSEPPSSVGATIRNFGPNWRFDRTWGWGSEVGVLGMAATLPILKAPTFYSLPELAGDMIRLLFVASTIVRRAPVLVHFELHASELAFVWERSESRQWPGDSGISRPARPRAACAQKAFDDGSLLLEAIHNTVVELLSISICDAHGQRVERELLSRVVHGEIESVPDAIKRRSI